MGNIRAKNFLWIAILIFIGTCLCFFPVFFEGFHRAHGDYSVAVHYPMLNLLDSMLHDRDLSLWQPYMHYGSSQIYPLAVLNPVSGVLCILVFLVLQLAGYTPEHFFALTHFCFLLVFCIFYGAGLFLLARKLLKTDVAQIVVLLMGIAGTHLYPSIWVGYYSVMYVPLFIYFLLNILLDHPKKTIVNLSGSVFCFGLCLSSSLIYIHSFLNFIIMLILTLLIFLLFEKNWWKNRILKYTQTKCYRYKNDFLYLFFSLIFLALILFCRNAIKIELSEMSLRRRPLDMTLDSFYKSIQANYNYSFGLMAIFRQTFDRYSNWIQPGITLPYTNSIGLIGFILVATFSWISRIRVFLFLLVMFFLTVFLAVSPKTTSPILFLLSKINPFFTWGTRFIGFNLVYSAPFLYLLFGLSLDNWCLTKKNFSNYQIKAIFIFIIALSSAGILLQWSQNFLIMLGICTLIFLTAYYLRSKGYLHTSLLILTTIAIGERIIDLRQFVAMTYHNDQAYTTTPWIQHVSVINKSGFPGPFPHHFSYWNEPYKLGPLYNRKGFYYDTYLNGTFKYFSANIWDYEWKHKISLDKIQPIRTPKLFIANGYNLCKSDSECISKTKDFFQGKINPYKVVLNTDVLNEILENGVDFSNNDKFYLGTHHKFNFEITSDLQHKNDSLRINLGEVFPKYLTTNFFNLDYENMTLISGGQKLNPIYFNFYSSIAPTYQIGYSDYRILEIFYPDKLKSRNIELQYTDMFESQKLLIKKFTRDNLHIVSNQSLPRLLVYMDRYHPDWKVSINGIESKIYRVNHEFKAVLVPSGKSDILFWFSKPLLKLQIWISYILILFVSLYILFYSLKKRHLIFWRNI